MQNRNCELLNRFLSYFNKIGAISPSLQILVNQGRLSGNKLICPHDPAPSPTSLRRTADADIVLPAFGRPFLLRHGKLRASRRIATAAIREARLSDGSRRSDDGSCSLHIINNDTIIL